MADLRYDEHLTAIKLASGKKTKDGKKLDDVMKALSPTRSKKIQQRAMELATLKDLRKAAEQTQADMAASLGVEQDTISRLEKRSDMLLSTLRH